MQGARKEKNRTPAKAVRFFPTRSVDYSVLGLVAFDVVYSSLNGSDLLGFFVRDFGLEFLFQSHHQLNGVKRIGTQVIDEGLLESHFLFLDAQLLGDDFLDAFFDGAHT
eukprot:Unigene12132_Nuclearia_a/m.36889 Unigene12132_Nuclearia_a/g.36889  ORF Unigene12132_Nuclearia_a/g.36889 Unigene12132_Nuclearia_a/m.36889 type:complete len:109 (-) Unigene12132_Nuclearia_a:153-479(-)